MKHSFLLFSVCLLLLLITTTAFADVVQTKLNVIINKWDKVTFEMSEDKHVTEYEKLLSEIKNLAENYPDRAEPLVWEGIILSTYAGAKGGLSALSIIKESRACLLEAEKINPNAENGSIYTTLGSLYYQAPGWPLSFGSDEKAEKYLTKALEIDPNGIDANYFYGDFLIEEGEYQKALVVLTRALTAPNRSNRTLADRGRKKDINKALQRAKSYLN